MNTEINAAFVKSLRARMGLSQAAFAKRVGCSATSVNAWEQGATRPGGLARAAMFALNTTAPAEVKPENRLKGKKLSRKQMKEIIKRVDDVRVRQGVTVAEACEGVVLPSTYYHAKRKLEGKTKTT